MARPRLLPFAALAFAACQAALPTAAPTPQGHGLERVWIESLGLE